MKKDIVRLVGTIVLSCSIIFLGHSMKKIVVNNVSIVVHVK